MNALKKKRLEKEFTQYALSYGAGVPPSYISLYERGYPVLKPYHKKAIAKFLGVNRVEEIFPPESK